MYGATHTRFRPLPKHDSYRIELVSNQDSVLRYWLEYFGTLFREIRAVQDTDWVQTNQYRTGRITYSPENKFKKICEKLKSRKAASIDLEIWKYGGVGVK